MNHPHLSEAKTRAISLSIMFLGFAVLSFTETWWPWLMAVVGLSVVVKQLLRGKTYEAILSLIIFTGIVITIGWDIGTHYFLPVFLILASIFLLFRAFFQPDVETEAEVEEEQNIEIGEEEAEEMDE